MATHLRRSVDNLPPLGSIPSRHSPVQHNGIKVVLWLFQSSEFHGVMRFFFQDEGQGAKVATKCIRVSSTASTADVLETLIEKFRPDMRMLSMPRYALYEVHVNGGRQQQAMP